MKHLEEKDQGYFEHMRGAFRRAWLSYKCGFIYELGALRYIVHAFLPMFFGNSTAKWVQKKQDQAWTKFVNDGGK